MKQLAEDKYLLHRMADSAYEKCKTQYAVEIVNEQMREQIGY